MASSSGAPPAATTTKKTTTPEQKRLFILLGVGGVLALLVGGRFLLGGSGGSDAGTEAPATTVAANPGAPDPGAGAGLDGGAPGAENPAGATAGIAQTSGDANSPASLLPLARYRPDPFLPFYIVPTPAPPQPVPPPPPTPEPPIRIPPLQAVDVPGPGGGFGGGGFGSGGGFATTGVPGPNNPNSVDRLPALPRVVIPRLNARNTSPADAFPPPRSASGGGGVTSPSFNKRLSGVVIGNGVRAVLEISGGTVPKTYVVQPGDVVEGITVLSISRFNEGGNQVTRMLIRENGGERYVDLKPGPPRTQVTEGGGGEGGEFGQGIP